MVSTKRHAVPGNKVVADLGFVFVGHAVSAVVEYSHPSGAPGQGQAARCMSFPYRGRGCHLRAPQRVIGSGRLSGWSCLPFL